MKRYKVEFKSTDGKSEFMAICYKDKLDYWKMICKNHSKDGVCYYREFPLTKSKRVYF